MSSREHLRKHALHVRRAKVAAQLSQHDVALREFSDAVNPLLSYLAATDADVRKNHARSQRQLDAETWCGCRGAHRIVSRIAGAPPVDANTHVQRGRCAANIHHHASAAASFLDASKLQAAAGRELRKTIHELLCYAEQQKKLACEASRAAASFPAYWEAQRLPIAEWTSHEYDCIDLSTTSRTYTQLEAEFYSTMSSTKSTRSSTEDTYVIRAIKVLRNPLKYRAFVGKCNALDVTRRVGEGANVHRLFHGTSAANIDAIMGAGFDRSFSRVARFGKGTYFARDASYSARDAYSAPDALGVKRVLVCDVIVGRTCVGRRGMTTPSSISGATLADSMVDNLAHPSIFVLSAGSDDHAYPSFIIEFQSMRRTSLRSK